MKQLSFLLAVLVGLSACGAPPPSPTPTAVPPTEQPPTSTPIPSLSELGPDEFESFYQNEFAFFKDTGVSSDGCRRLAVERFFLTDTESIIRTVEVQLVDDPAKCPWQNQADFVQGFLDTWHYSDVQGWVLNALISANSASPVSIPVEDGQVISVRYLSQYLLSDQGNYKSMTVWMCGWQASSCYNRE